MHPPLRVARSERKLIPHEPNKDPWESRMAGRKRRSLSDRSKRIMGILWYFASISALLEFICGELPDGAWISLPGAS